MANIYNNIYSYKYIASVSSVGHARGFKLNIYTGSLVDSSLPFGAETEVGVCLLSGWYLACRLWYILGSRLGVEMNPGLLYQLSVTPRFIV